MDQELSALQTVHRGEQLCLLISCAGSSLCGGRRIIQPPCRQSSGESAALAQLPNSSHFKLKKKKIRWLLGFLCFPQTPCVQEPLKRPMSQWMLFWVTWTSLFCRQDSVSKEGETLEPNVCKSVGSQYRKGATWQVHILTRRKVCLGDTGANENMHNEGLYWLPFWTYHPAPTCLTLLPIKRFHPAWQTNRKSDPDCINATPWDAAGTFRHPSINIREIMGHSFLI